MKRVRGQTGMKVGFWKLTLTAGIGYTNNWPTWYA
jgi:hypothetical protein